MRLVGSWGCELGLEGFLKDVKDGCCLNWDFRDLVLVVGGLIFGLGRRRHLASPPILDASECIAAQA